MTHAKPRLIGSFFILEQLHAIEGFVVRNENLPSATKQSDAPPTSRAFPPVCLLSYLPHDTSREAKMSPRTLTQSPESLPGDIPTVCNPPSHARSAPAQRRVSVPLGTISTNTRRQATTPVGRRSAVERARGPTRRSPGILGRTTVLGGSFLPEGQRVNRGRLRSLFLLRVDNRRLDG